MLYWNVPATRRFASSVDTRPRNLTPAADVLDDGDTYQLVLEMPGVTQDKLMIDLEHGELIVRGERSGYDDKLQLKYNGRFAASTLEKRFTLGEDVDRTNVSATLENGLLYITLPRKAEDKTRKIAVEVK